MSPHSAAISTAAAASTVSARAMANARAFVAPRHSPGALRRVEAGRLGRADRLVTELRVANGRAEDGEEQVTRDGERVELVVRKDGDGGAGGNAGAGCVCKGSEVVGHGAAPFTPGEGAAP
ncbi:hypothetical protein Anae109_3787 [Anaeromyxobacter sp. Fw109-5]|nr:hypothetical protein Anae109_3787 [Anaeromyxobacter sp. Fw109-5]